MRLWQDTCQGGAWAYCYGCRFKGDLISIFAEVKKVSESIAIAMLEEEGLISGRLNRQHLLQQRQIEVFDGVTTGLTLWEEASRGGRVALDPAANTLRSRMQLNMESSLSWTNQGPGQLAGFMDSRRIEKILHDNARNLATRRREAKFKLPREIESCLVVPFYDVPGRISSLSFVSSDHRNSPWKIVTHPLAYGSSSKPWEEGGIAIHPKLLTNPGDDTLLLTNDLNTYLRLHAKHFISSSKPLQLACYHDSEIKTTAWQMIANRDLIVWSPQIRPQDMWLAIHLQAKIATKAPKGLPLHTICRDSSPLHVYKQCRQQARPWPDVLASLVSKYDVEELVDWFSKMSLDEGEQYLVIEACPPKFSKKLARVFNQTITTRTVSLDDGYVDQRTNGWFYVRPGKQDELITNSPFWIEHAIHQISKNKTSQLYGIKSTLNGQTISFEVPVRSFDRDPFKYVQERMISQGVGVPTQKHSWKNKVRHISGQLSQPIVIRRSTIAGYCKQDDCFHLPRYVIDASTGNFDTLAGPINEKMPGRPITLKRVYDEQLEDFLNQPGIETYLAVFSSLLTQILAPSANILCPQILFSNSRLNRPVTQVSQIIGVPISEQSQYGEINRQLNEHSWPLVTNVLKPVPAKVTKAIVQKMIGKPIVSRTTLVQQLYGELSGTAVGLDAKTGFDSIPFDQLRLLRQIAGSVIHHFCKERLADKLHNLGSPVFGTIGVIEHWLNGRNVTRKCLASVRDLVHGDLHLSVTLPRVMATLAVAGKAKNLMINNKSGLSKLARQTTEPTLFHVRDTNEVYLCRDQLQKIIEDNNAPRIDTAELTVRLSEEGPPARLDLVDDTFMFAVRAEAFHYHRQRRQAVLRDMRVIS